MQYPGYMSFESNAEIISVLALFSNKQENDIRRGYSNI